MAEPLVFVGIDVSKATLDVAVRPAGTTFRVANDPDGIAALVARLRPLAPALVVLEATGGYEALAVAAPQVAGLPVAAVNPRQARDFARATGRLPKSDRIDAQALAHFAEAIRPEPRPAVPVRGEHGRCPRATRWAFRRATAARQEWSGSSTCPRNTRRVTSGEKMRSSQPPTVASACDRSWSVSTSVNGSPPSWRN